MLNIIGGALALMIKFFVRNAIAIALLLPLTAQANWAFTRWGQSPDQVISASQGKAHMVEVNGQQHLQLDEYAAAGYTYSVMFSFKDEALTRVTLVGESPGKCSGTLSALVGKYAAGNDVESRHKHFVWRDESEGNLISFYDESDMQLPGPPLYCFVMYEPLMSAGLGL